MRNLLHQSIGRLPSHTTLCRMMLEGLSISEVQLGKTLSKEGLQNFTIQTDGTTKYGDHFAMFDIQNVATGENLTPLEFALCFLGQPKTL